MQRPPRNRRQLGDPDLDWDLDLEDALFSTLDTDKSRRVELSVFHSSPCKGRLWSLGFKVHHRVLPDKQWVAAWIEREDNKTDEELCHELAERCRYHRNYWINLTPADRAALRRIRALDDSAKLPYYAQLRRIYAKLRRTTNND